METASNDAPERPAIESKQLYAATLHLRATPFRSDKFALALLERLPGMLDFGASGYTFIRSDQDKVLFDFLSYWEDKADFEQWWHSREMQEFRVEVQGWAELNVYPAWSTVLEQTGVAG